MKKNENHRLSKIIFRKEFTDRLSLLRVEREDVDFLPGQYFHLGLPSGDDLRPYSVFSGIDDPWLDFVIQKIQPEGVAHQLMRLDEGQLLKIEGPKGFFTLPKSYQTGNPVVFIATGTGIAPFHSYIRSYPQLNYRLLYGARTADELMGIEIFDTNRMLTVLSRQPGYHFHGHVTDYLDQVISPEALFMICGNSQMVTEVTTRLRQTLGNNAKIRTEYY